MQGLGRQGARQSVQKHRQLMDMFYVNGAITVPGMEPALSQNATDPPVRHQNTARADHGPVGTGLCRDSSVLGMRSHSHLCQATLCRDVPNPTGDLICRPHILKGKS